MSKKGKMTNLKMIRFLQMFFDGNFESIDEVISNTGLTRADAAEVYEAINRLKNLPYEQIANWPDVKDG